MNNIGAIGQAFIDILFAQLYDFRFIRLLQPRSFTVVDGRVVTLGPITHFVNIQLSLRNEWGRINTETFNLFLTKLGQYPIILGLPWFRKHSPHIWFNKNIVTFNSPHYLQHCSLSHQAMTVSGFNIPFDHPPCLLTLSNQAVTFPALMILLLILIPICCHTTIIILGFHSIKLWMYLVLINPPTAVFIPRPCPRLVRPLLVPTPLGVTILVFVIFIIYVTASISLIVLKQWTKNFCDLKIGFYPPSLIHRKSSLNYQLWISQWLKLRLSIH